ncbi:hypothetical protein BJF91_08585 [Allorhizobium taibaishanense]|uniref:Uncharacterized protein n=1 Tax=Allorhizobium taibaishanense TaxID=887144 RepID=A0A1Q9A131_9HYPH|nr:hypothetical protein BJF91_08585 [Allorhizobium taibaishanense]
MHELSTAIFQRMPKLLGCTAMNIVPLALVVTDRAARDIGMRRQLGLSPIEKASRRPAEGRA